MSVATNTNSSPVTDSRRAALAERLKKLAKEPSAGTPLSYAQQRLWFLDQLQPGTPLYNVTSVANVKGPLDCKVLECTINAVIARHEALRTRFEQDGDGPIQIVDPSATIRIDFRDVSALAEAERSARAREMIKNAASQPFDLSQDRLIRVLLVRLQPEIHVLAVVMHHIISDEWSLKVFFAELAAAYKGFAKASPASLPELPIQYSDFAAWQRKWLRGEILDKQLGFWKKSLSGVLPVTELPMDRPRPSVPRFRGAYASRLVSKELLQNWRQFAEQEKATLFMVTLAGFNCLVSRCTGGKDLIIGSPIAGRNRLETEGLIGFFVNTLPLRVSLEGNPSFREVLRRVRQVTLDAYAHQDLPLDRLVEEIRPERSLTHMPLTSLMFSFQASLLEEIEIGSIRLEFVDFEADTAKFDFTLVAQETSKGLMLKAEYDVALFNKDTVERILEHLEILLTGAVAEPETNLAELPVMSRSERRLLLNEWSRAESTYPRSKCIHEVFEEQAVAAPGALALSFGEKRLTYGELNSRANQVAHYLRRFGIGPDKPVAICARRSPELIVGILGILKAGGVYVPLDANYPKDRLEFMLRDTEASVLLTEQGLLSELPCTPATTLCLDSDSELLAVEPRHNPVNVCGPENLAYIMYTSGSTGTPKGVCVPHRAVNRLVLNTNYIQLSPADRIAQISNVSFDAATFEIWGALLNGAQLIKIGKDVALAPAEFGHELRRQNITALFLTTALFNQFANDDPRMFASVNTVMFGGEACDIKSVRKVMSHHPPKRLLHVYGPTENTTFSTFFQVDQTVLSCSTVPIGGPIANTSVYVLDGNMQPAPIGVPGELYVGGDGVARGYWKREDLTQQCFVNGIIPENRSAPLYKTGDLVRWLPEGRIEFLGRVDEQVKIRGFRVEPGEIEAVLLQNASVRECVVCVRGAGTSRRLVAYIVPEPGAQINASELRSFLKEKLPDYMVPGAFVALQALPLTPNGKVHREVLPDPDQARPELEHGYMAPRDDVEERLARIWEGVLGVQPVGVRDKFFDLGGHSLLAVRLVTKIEKSFGRKLRLATIFQASTIEQLASVVREEVRESSLTSRTSIVEIQAKGSHRPIFLVHGAGGGMFWGYVNLSRHLGSDQPLYGFRSRGLDGLEEFDSIEELASHYVADLKAFQPEGPYYLGGYCFGGNVAYEMACQLEAAGDKVAMLALINASPANSKYMSIPWTPLWAARFARNLLYWGRYCMNWSATQRQEFISWKLDVVRRKLSQLNRRNGSSRPKSKIDPANLVDLSSYSADQKRVWEAHIRALVTYHPRKYGGRVHLLRSAGHPLWCSFEPDYGWSELAAGGVAIHIVPGAHEKVLEEPCVREVASCLQKIARDATGVKPRFKVEAAALTAAGGAAVAGMGWLGAEVLELLTQAGEFLGAAAPAVLLARNSKQEAESGLSDSDRQLLRSWNNTACNFDLSGCYISHFERRVKESPEAPAVWSNGQETSYKELDHRASQIASQLITLGLEPGQLVGVCLGRSMELIATLLGVWKAGGAYLPLDPNYPQERLHYMMEDSGASLLVLEQRYTDNFAGFGGARLVIDEATNGEERPNYAELRKRQADSRSTAYVIYTSGSTGKPKGVEITHQSLLNHNYAVIQIYGLDSSERVAQFSPISFDISVEEIFPTLLCGGTIILRDENSISSMEAFFAFVSAARVTSLNIPTAYWHEIVEQLERHPFPSCVRLVVIGGEKASDEAFRKWKSHVDLSRVELINSYGPTETTVTATYYIAKPGDDTLPIGKPLPNVQIAVLDAEMRRLAPGETGELFIGGEGLARGYLNRPDVTAERFVPNPFKDIRSARIYRTGDLVRFREDGNLEFVGRTDHQVKIRGFRIELGEIESALLAHEKVRDAVVLAREDKKGQKRLVAYVSARNGHAPHITELITFLRRQMPAHMVPSAFVLMPAFPMTPAGKVDRLALPPPGRNRPDLDQEYVAPRNPLESAIASIYREVLEFEQVGVLDSFFDLGGHSLAATQVIARLRETFSLNIPLGNFFANSTVAQISAHVQATCKVLSVPFALVDGARKLEMIPSQTRVWFLDQYNPDQSPYNLPVGIRLKGPLDIRALEQSLTSLSSRHEALRCVFPEEHGTPVQYVFPAGPVAIARIDLQHVPEAQRKSEALRICSEEGRRNYITYHQVLNPLLITLAEKEHILLLVLHEIAVDSVSIPTLLAEFAEFYDAAISSREPVLEESTSYPQMLAELARREAMANPELEKFWTETLAGAPPILDLPADRPRNVARTDDGACMEIRLPGRIAISLQNQTQETEAILTAAFVAMLHRYTNANDIVVGSSVSAAFASSLPVQGVGPLEDYVVLRKNVDPSSSFQAFVVECKEMLANARTHAGLPFSRVVQLTNPARNASSTPIFQVLFRFEEETGLAFCPGGLSMAPFDVDNKATKFDLSVTVRKARRDLRLVIRYSTALFDADRVERLTRHFTNLLGAAIEDPSKSISALPLLDDAEKEQVIVEWNRTERPFAAHKTIDRLISEQCRRTPHSVAVVAGQEEIRYAQLDSLSARVAAKLRALGVGTERRVALCMERSEMLVPAIFGILRTGAAYVPIDPLYPRDRIQFMIDDSQASVVLTNRNLAETLPAGQSMVVFIEDIFDSDVPDLAVLTGSAPNPEDPAYIIYTSGSTGQPKGVVIEHRNAVAFTHWVKDHFDSEELSGVLAGTSVCFDLSIFELLAPLCWGGRVILAPNALALPNLAARDQVKLVNTVPSAIRELLRLKGIPETVKTINLAGEPLLAGLVDELYAGTKAVRVLDLYGPTETTTYSTGALRRTGERATIGRPLDNEQVYVLDSARQPVPIGIRGEIYIGGAGVARGYYNRPDLTAERFVPNPFAPGERMYRTGDHGRWRADSCLEYLGRGDGQVKIRGYRIELGEIEVLLRAHPSVAAAVVVIRDTPEGDKTLAAYVELKEPLGGGTAELQSFLKEKLPSYAVPASIAILDQLPLTPNGKIDRKNLAMQAFVPGIKGVIEPRTETEARLLEIWRSVLPAGKYGVTENFFELGGDSILAIRVIARIRDALGTAVPLYSLFDHPTIEGLSRVLATDEFGHTDGEFSAIRPVLRDKPVPASFVQERLWFIDQFDPGSDAYNVPAALRLKGPLDLHRLRCALQEVVQRHEALRTTLVLEDATLTQRIADSLEVDITVQDVRSGTSEQTEEELRRAIQSVAAKPFDLATGPLIRAHLFRLGEEEHVLLFCLHHTISDGWSLAILFRELEAFYLGEGESSLPELPVQYADYAHWQRNQMSGNSLQKELTFWKETMKGAPVAVKFPGTEGRPRSKKVERHILRFQETELRSMGVTAQETGATPFAVLMAGLSLVLSKWSGQSDLVVGTVVAGRTRREVEPLIGCFMNFLPIRSRLKAGLGKQELVKDTARALIDAQSHQDCPFEKIVEAINPARRDDGNPLYNVALLWQNFPHDLFQGEGLETSLVPVAPTSALLDLRFEAEQQDNELSLTCEYRSGLFQEETIASLLRSVAEAVRFLSAPGAETIDAFNVGQGLLGELSQEPAKASQTIAVSGTFTLEPLAESLQHWASELGWDATVEFAPYNQVFQELLTPSSLSGLNANGANVAVIRFEDWVRDRNQISDPSARRYVEQGVKEFVQALESFAGRSAVPLLVCVCPPSAKVSRLPGLSAFLESQEASLARAIESLPSVHLLLHKEISRWYPVEECHDAAAEELGHVPYTPIFYTAVGTAIARKLHAIKRPPVKVIALDCDHTIWSGVCGEDGPAGLRMDEPWKILQEFMREQRNAGRLLVLCSKNNPEDVEAVFSRREDMPLRREHFAAVRLNWEPKSQNLRSIARELNLGLDSFVFLDDNPVECAEVEANCPEVLTLPLPDKPEEFGMFLKHCWVFDHAKLTAEDRKRADMYRQNTERERLRNQSSNLADFIAGLDLKVQIQELADADVPRAAQLTQRTNQFNLTTRRRTESEIAVLKSTHGILTVTVSDRFGDYGLVGLVVFRGEGELLDVDTFLLSCRVLGRGVEHRVLSRLGEIARERRLNWVDLHYSPTAKNKPALNFLEATAGAFRQHSNGGLLFRLPAGFAAEVTFNVASQAAEDLPEQAKTLETGGKVEKFSACRDIAIKSNDITRIHRRIESQNARNGQIREAGPAPETKMEKTLAEIWAKLLRRTDIGVTDNFFDLGGHSLLAVRLFAEIGRVTGRKLPLVTLFQAPTIRELAVILQRDQERKPSGPEALLVPIQPLGSKEPLFLVHGAGGDVLWGYANLAAHLGTDRPIFGIKSRGQIGLEECQTIPEMAVCYVQAVRAKQPHGPYHLGGYCFGGNVAYEMARLLRAAGEEVALVALLDSSPSNAGYEDLHWSSPRFAWRFIKNGMYWLGDFVRQPFRDQVRFVARKGRVMGRKLRAKLARGGEGKVDLEEIIDLGHFPEHELKLWQTHIQALVSHVEQPYEGSVVLFRTKGQPVLCSFAEDFCWANLVRGGVKITYIPGSHENIFLEPNVKILANELAKTLPHGHGLAEPQSREAAAV